MIKRLLMVLIVGVVFSMTACGQTAYDTPQTVVWDAPVAGADGYEVAVQLWRGGEMIVVGETVETSLMVDLEALELYGWYRVMVRSYALDDTPNGEERVYSGYASSTRIEDVADETFWLRRRKVPGAPAQMRLQ